MPARWVARGGGRSATPASPNATGTATATWTPGPGPWTSPIPKLRSGTYFPEWLLQRRRRAEAALTSVVATCYLLGASTRRMDKLVQSLGITGLSKSQVSVVAKDLDARAYDFRTRPLDAGPYTFLAADALTMKVREGGRVVKVAVMLATAVNSDGYREILGVQVASAESGRRPSHEGGERRKIHVQFGRAPRVVHRAEADTF